MLSPWGQSKASTGILCTPDEVTVRDIRVRFVLSLSRELATVQLHSVLTLL